MNTAACDAISSARRTHARSAGPTRLQREQKQATRERLLKAAENVFSTTSYAAASVEEIIANACVGRTSFYRHFDSKWSIASALCEQVMPEVWALWEELARLGHPSEKEIADWLRHRIAVYGRHRALFTVMKEAVAIEANGFDAIERMHVGVIEVLAKGIAAFALAMQDSTAGREARVMASLLLMQLDEFNYRLAVHGWDVDFDVAVLMMARQIRQFIERTC
ncbi:putative TetR family transcriptional regulator [Caenibius tardaugens NBRC 16725]|uniref:Putative TetR family transcriptional regulator n=1 Tax=Caenibius tardaugens NBRC 16725 TaxID=1219035 RepID=U2YC53_9SPHN|nr:TetR/AcrR family transcriptional regulator [Caenibius tardaugens]GAD51141.1 putative TetR family transcriptional regulator [Caenibius tardaugens NBRC 16725]